MTQLFCIAFGTASVVILLSFGIDQVSLMCPLYGAFIGLLDVRHMLGEIIILDSQLRSLALLRVCLSIHLKMSLPSHYLTRFTCRCF